MSEWVSSAPLMRYALPASLVSGIARAAECALAMLLLLLCAPLLLLAALAIWFDDEGPVLYRQTRIGLRGHPFEMLKFRSMRVDAESDGQARWATPNDQRTTRVGRFIRLARIDELPQLINVLRGEMRIIGPRPERPCFVETLSVELPAFHKRHLVKPGITGWAQVRCGYADSLAAAARKLEHDLYYIEHRSIALDLRIVLETVRVVLVAQGAR